MTYTHEVQMNRMFLMPSMMMAMMNMMMSRGKDSDCV